MSWIGLRRQNPFGQRSEFSGPFFFYKPSSFFFFLLLWSLWLSSLSETEKRKRKRGILFWGFFFWGYWWFQCERLQSDCRLGGFLLSLDFDFLVMRRKKERQEFLLRIFFVASSGFFFQCFISQIFVSFNFSFHLEKKERDSLSRFFFVFLQILGGFSASFQLD